MLTSEIHLPDDMITDWQRRFSSKEPLCLRIDFLGPPAAGKSTLCKSVFAKLGDERRHDWIDIQEAKRLAIRNALLKAIPKRSLKARVSELMRVLLDALTPNIRNPEAPRYLSRSLDSLQEHLMESFATTNHAYLEALAEQWHDPDTPVPPRFERFNLVRQWIKELLFMASFVGDTSVMADNARLTKGMAELLSNTRFPDAEKIVAQYCQSPLAPTGIIHLAATAETIYQRSKQRQTESGRLNPGHASRSETEMKSYTERKNEVNGQAIRFFEKNGIAVLNLSAESELVINVDQVVSFLKGMNQMHPHREQV